MTRPRTLARYERLSTSPSRFRCIAGDLVGEGQTKAAALAAALGLPPVPDRRGRARTRSIYVRLTQSSPVSFRCEMADGRTGEGRTKRKALAAALGLPEPPEQRGKPRGRGPRKPRAKPVRIEGAELATRKRLIDDARAKLHTQRGRPADGTSLAELAKHLGVSRQFLSAPLRSPSLDAKLAEYLYGCPDETRPP